MSTATKGKVGIKAAKTVVKHPRMLRLGARTGRLAIKAGKPIAKRRLRRRGRDLGRAAGSIRQAVVLYGPWLAYESGLVERPKPKRTAPRVVMGIVIGASAMYFLEPGHGEEHRKQVAQLVGRS